MPNIIIVTASTRNEALALLLLGKDKTSKSHVGNIVTSRSHLVLSSGSCCNAKLSPFSTKIITNPKNRLILCQCG